MKIKTQDTLLNYKVIGTGYPVVFLHGFLESNSMWKQLPLEDLNVQVIQIDLPGHGESIDLKDLVGASINLMAQEVLKVIEKLALNDFSIVGHSMGGYVALEIQALLHRCDKVVLLNSNFWADSLEKINDRKRIAEIVMTAKSLFLKEAIPNLFLNTVNFKKEINELLIEANDISSSAIAFASLAMANRNDFTQLVKEGKINLTVIQGEIDRIVPIEKMNLEISSDIDYFILPNTGHMSHVENPLGVMAVLKEIFDEKKRKP